MARFKRHILICENIRDENHPRGSCGRCGAEEIRKKFKAELRSRKLTTVYRASKSGCLDACEYGPVAVVYPDDVWYGGITADDVTEIIDSHIVGGTPVERLVIRDERFHQDFGETSGD